MDLSSERIDVLDPMEMTAEDLRATYRIERLVHDEMSPGEAMRTEQAFVDFVRTATPNRHRRCVVAKSPDGMAGIAWITWRLGDQNRHLARLELGVDPARRRRGVGRALLRAAARHAEEDGRTLLQLWTSSRVPAGEAFCRALEARIGMTARESSLDLTAVDRAQLERWIGSGEALPDYELLFVPAPTPEQLLPQVAAAFNVMNSAPRDDLQEEDETVTPDELVARERAWGAGGHRQWRMFAKHVASGEFIGLTELGWEPHDPRLITQGDTAVRPDHRGRGLAKWLKAAMIRKVLDEVREARSITTGNAYSNDAMLAINNALGFKESASWSVWELEAAAVA